MADFNYINSSGAIVPDTSTTRAEVEAGWRAAFGADMPMDASTPQGVIATMMIEQRDAVARNNSELANQINPDLAGGVFLDALWRLLGGARNPAVSSSLIGVNLTGQPSTLIPAGSIAAASATGAQFALSDAVILDGTGAAVGNFVALVPGPIALGIGGLDQIASGVLGWETVSNPTAAIQGRDVEGDIPSRRRRRQTLALQTMSVLEAITSRLYELPNLRSLYAIENYTDAPQVVDGVNLIAHSIWVCVDGGTDAEIAQVLFNTKTVGAGYNGAVTVQVADPTNGRLYDVQFDRPVEKPLLIRVTMGPSSMDVQTLVPQLVMNYVNGLLNGDPSFTVGTDVSPWEIAGIINQQEPTLNVRKVELQLVGTGIWSTDVYDIKPNEVARTQLSSVTVLIP